MLGFDSGTTINFWDVEYMKKEHFGVLSHPQKIMFSSDGTTLASISDNDIQLWDVNSRQIVKVLQGHTDAVIDMDISPDGSKLISTSLDKSTKIWDVEAKKILRSIPHETNSGEAYIRISPTGKIFATASTASTASGEYLRKIKLRDLINGQTTCVISGHAGIISSFAFSPDGSKLVSGSDDQTIKFWNTNTCKIEKTLTSSNRITNINFSPKGTILASGTSDGNIDLRDPKSGELKQTLIGHSHDISSIAFSPDESMLISGSRDFSVKLWDLRTGQLINTIFEHQSEVMSTAYSPNGNLILSASGNKIIISEVNQYTSTPDGKKIKKWLDKQEITSGLHLDNLDVKPIKSEPNLFSNSLIHPPSWSKYHPFHWLKSANNGNSEAMLQLGIIYHRIPDNKKAKHWYSKALEAGHPKAQQRMEVLKQTMEVAING